jgi:hypothetical protein
MPLLLSRKRLLQVRQWEMEHRNTISINMVHPLSWHLITILITWWDIIKLSPCLQLDHLVLPLMELELPLWHRQCITRTTTIIMRTSTIGATLTRSMPPCR